MLTPARVSRRGYGQHVPRDCGCEKGSGWMSLVGWDKVHMAECAKIRMIDLIITLKLALILHK